jgi:hypothetical protein
VLGGAVCFLDVIERGEQGEEEEEEKKGEKSAAQKARCPHSAHLFLLLLHF